MRAQRDDYTEDFLSNPCSDCGSPAGVPCAHDESYDEARAAIATVRRKRSARKKAVRALGVLVSRYRRTMPTLSSELADIVKILETS